MHRRCTRISSKRGKLQCVKYWQNFEGTGILLTLLYVHRVMSAAKLDITRLRSQMRNSSSKTDRSQGASNELDELPVAVVSPSHSDEEQRGDVDRCKA